MSKRVAVFALTTLIALGASASVAGNTAIQPTKQVYGVYIGVDAGSLYNTTLDKTAQEWAITQNETYGPSFTFNSKKNAPWGFTFSGTVGYRFNNYWAVQGGYIWDNQQKAKYNNGSVTTAYRFDQYHWYLAFKGRLHLVNAISSFIMVGAARTRQKLIESKSTGASPADLKYDFWSPMGAVGLVYNVSKNFSVDLQYMYIFSSIKQPLDTQKYLIMGASTQRFTLGLMYLFTL